MSEAKAIGIVTVTYNSGQVIDDFMKSLLAQTYREFLLYIIENASTDNTLDRIAAYHDPRIIVLVNTKNNGIAGGNNQGICAAFDGGCGDILLANNDIVFEPGLLAGLIADLDASGGDMIVPKIYYHDVPNKIWCAGGRFNRWLGYANRHDGQDEIDHGQYETVRQIEYSPTCCMLIRKTVFDRVGLFDETYFVYFDDTDYCFRVMKAGLKLIYTPHVSLLHKVSSLTGATNHHFQSVCPHVQSLFYEEEPQSPDQPVVDRGL